MELEADTLSQAQIEGAERLANEIVTEDRAVKIRFVSLEEARQLGVRKLPPGQTGQLRLIDITEFDLTACGDTHAESTGPVRAILLPPVAKEKQGAPVELACGVRDAATAPLDFIALT